MAERLADMVERTNELFRKLAEAGHEDAARAILGLPPVEQLPQVQPPAPEPQPPPPVSGPQAPPPAPEPEPPAPEPAPEPELPEPGPPPPEPGPPPAAPPLPEEEDEDEEDEEEEEAESPPDQERYLLTGAGILIPFIADLGLAYRTFARTWKDASIGSTKDEYGRPTESRPPFGPDAMVRGGDLDPGKRIPPHALRNEATFTSWARSNGYDGGVSVEIDGLLMPPGVTVVLPEHEVEKRAGRQRRWWVPESLRSPENDDGGGDA